MKTMHGVRTVLVVLALAPLFSLAAAQVEDKAPVSEPRVTPAPVAPANDAPGVPPGMRGGPASQAATPGAGAVGSDQDIRDVRGPIDIPDPWAWAPYAAAGLLGLVVLYAAWRMLRRRQELAKAPHERAFEALEAARSLMEPEHAREFSFRVSGAVRVYIEERFAVSSTHQTTSEFLRCVSEQESGPLAQQRVLLAEFLKNCDLVKFARFALTKEEMEAMHRSAWQFVDSTKPVAENPPRRALASRRQSETGTAAREDPAVRQNHFAVGGVS